MPPTKNDLDDIRLLDARQVADALGRSVDTLNAWVAARQFPAPIQAYPGAKKQWTLAVVKAWIEQRRRARYRARSPRGALMRGRHLQQQAKRVRK
jgi:predicted DNA-binding transcriptional regulator AlpA